MLLNGARFIKKLDGVSKQSHAHGFTQSRIKDPDQVTVRNGHRHHSVYGQAFAWHHGCGPKINDDRRRAVLLGPVDFLDTPWPLFVDIRSQNYHGRIAHAVT